MLRLRILIGIYLTAGSLYVVLTSLLAFQALQIAAASRLHRDRDGVFELTFIAGIGLFIAALLFLTAYGLAKRWWQVRLVLLVCSWWTLAVCAFGVVMEVGKWAGLTDGRMFGANGPPMQSLLIAMSVSAFAGLHLWILMTPAIKESFRRPNERSP